MGLVGTNGFGDKYLGLMELCERGVWEGSVKLHLDPGNISECGHGTEQNRCDMKLAPPPRSYRRSVEPLALLILYWAFRRKFLLIFGTSRLGFETISSIVPLSKKASWFGPILPTEKPRPLLSWILIFLRVTGWKDEFAQIRFSPWKLASIHGSSLQLHTKSLDFLSIFFVPVCGIARP